MQDRQVVRKIIHITYRVEARWRLSLELLNFAGLEKMPPGSKLPVNPAPALPELKARRVHIQRSRSKRDLQKPLQMSSSCFTDRFYSTPQTVLDLQLQKEKDRLFLWSIRQFYEFSSSQSGGSATSLEMKPELRSPTQESQWWPGKWIHKDKERPTFYAVSEFFFNPDFISYAFSSNSIWTRCCLFVFIPGRVHTIHSLCTTQMQTAAPHVSAHAVRSRDMVLTFQVLNQSNSRIRVWDLEILVSATAWDRGLQESAQLLRGLRPARLCPPDAGFLLSPWWYQVVVLLLLVPWETGISDFKAFSPNFSSPGLLKIFCLSCCCGSYCS